MKRLTCACILVLLCSGCYRISYRLNSQPGKTYRVSSWNQFFLYGLVPAQESYDSNRLCGADEVTELRSSMRPANVLSGLLSMWLTGATTLEGVCLLESSRSSVDVPSIDTTPVDPSRGDRGSIYDEPPYGS